MNFYVKNLLGFVEGTSVMLTSGLAYENTSLQLSICFLDPCKSV